MDKSPELKTSLNPFFILSIVYILLNFCRNIDGFEILDFHLFYRPLTKEKNGLPWLTVWVHQEMP